MFWSARLGGFQGGGCGRVVLAWDYALDAIGNHRAALLAYLSKFHTYGGNPREYVAVDDSASGYWWVPTDSATRAVWFGEPYMAPIELAVA